MRSERRLTRLETQVQARADKEAETLLADLSTWTDAELDAAIKAIEDAPHTPEEQAYIDWLNRLAPAQLLGEHHATRDN